MFKGKPLNVWDPKRDIEDNIEHLRYDKVIAARRNSSSKE
jgi:hypothetical protein